MLEPVNTEVMVMMMTGVMTMLEPVGMDIMDMICMAKMIY